MSKKYNDPELDAFLSFLHIDTKKMKYHGKSSLNGFHIFTEKGSKRKFRKLFTRNK